MKPSGSRPSYVPSGSWIAQLGVTRQKLSQRSRQVWPICPRSSTTCSTLAFVSTQLVARPACPAPTIATGTCSTRSGRVVSPRIRFLGDLLHFHAFLLDDHVAVVVLDHALDQRILVADLEQELLRVGTDALVLAGRDGDPLSAVHVAALAEDVELPRDRAERLVDFLNALVDFTEHGFVQSE